MPAVGPCPVTQEFIHVLGSRKDYAIWDGDDEFSTHLAERAQHVDATFPAQRLRCFFLIEAVYFSLLPRVLTSPSINHELTNQVKRFLTSPDSWDRSWLGLKRTTQNLQEVNKEIALISMEIKMTRPATAPMILGTFEPMTRAVGRLIEIVDFFARLLRVRRAREAELPRVAAFVADLFLHLKADRSLLVGVAHTLMSVSLANPELPTRYRAP